jgi:rubredoxin
MKKTEETNWWKCSACGFTVQQPLPPEKCPSCKEACAFTEVSCYTPECGGPGKPDPRLMGGNKE